MRPTLLVVAAAPLLVVLVGPLASYGTGALPGTVGSLGTVPLNVATDAPACGFCHGGNGNENGLVVSVVPTARILSAGQAISITTSSTGGQVHPQNWGGFVTKVTRGVLVAGATSQTNAAADHITHDFAFTGNRNWRYGYTAPATPGVVDVFSVVNTVDGAGTNTGDLWGFHGTTVGALLNTPARLYVNAAGVQPIGTSCAGGFGNIPVFGALTPARIGQTATFELHGAAPNAAVAVFVAANPSFQPIDLGLIGITGCTLWVDVVLVLNATTSAGDAARGEGRATRTLPIPADQSLVGQQIELQAAFLDARAARPLLITLTNGLAVTILP